MANNTTDPDSRGTSELLVGERIDEVTRVICVVIGSVMILSAVLGNSTLIVIVFKNFMHNRKKNLHDLFIFNLVLDDLLLMAYWFAFFVLDLALGYHPVVDRSHCTANGIVLIVLYMVNLDSLVSISFNRYLHVCHYHLYRRVFTMPRTVGWCVTIWVASLLLALPPLWGGAAGFYFYNTKTHVCSYNRDGFTYLKVLVILYTILPPIFLAYFNFAIFRFWKKARMSLSSRYPLAKKEGEKTKKKKRGLLAKWRTGKSNQESVPGTSEEQEIHLHQKPSEVVAHSCRANVSQGVTHRAATSLKGADEEERMSSAVREATETSRSPNGDDAGDTEVAAPGFPQGFRMKTNATDDTSSDSDSDDVDNVNDNEDSDSNDKAESYRLGDTAAADDSIRHKTGTFGGAAKLALRTQDEETETETELDETRTDTDSRQWDSTSVVASSTTTSHLPSSSCDSQKPLTLKRGKPQQQQQQQQQKKKKKITTKQHHEQLRKKSQSREKAFVRSLLVVCLLALFTFLPYTALVMVDTYIKQPKEVHITANLMVFLNNTVNWIVYGAMNPAFRRGYVKYFRRILKACRH